MVTWSEVDVSQWSDMSQRQSIRLDSKQPKHVHVDMRCAESASNI